MNKSKSVSNLRKLPWNKPEIKSELNILETLGGGAGDPNNMWGAGWSNPAGAGDAGSTGGDAGTNDGVFGEVLSDQNTTGGG